MKVVPLVDTSLLKDVVCPVENAMTQTRECSHCEKDFTSYGNRIYCDSCSWDLHYSRNWYQRDNTKEKWMAEQRRYRVMGYRGSFGNR